MGLSGFLLLSFLERYFLQAMEDSLIAQARITAQALLPGARVSGPAVEAQAPAYNAVQQQQAGILSVQSLMSPHRQLIRRSIWATWPMLPSNLAAS
jgi:hypothetical protein